MTDPIDLTKLAARLQAIHEEDHERGCEGRCYVCSCGYNDVTEQTARDAHATILAQAARIEALKDTLRSIAEGNLGAEPWQANYDAIRNVARAALTEGTT